MKLKNAELLAYTLVGIHAEIARLQAVADALARANGTPAPPLRESPRPRRTLTQAQRKAISKRMKASWRKRRAEAKS